jgi:hypothetical protein
VRARCNYGNAAKGVDDFMSSDHPCHQRCPYQQSRLCHWVIHVIIVVHVIFGHVGSIGKHWEPSDNLFPHLYKKCCFCMYQDVIIPKQRLVCGLSNVSGDEKNRSFNVQSNAHGVVTPPPHVVVVGPTCMLNQRGF